tara:strand:- start:98 stop:481 length:384 start_codon:yes stop_codon:yes gene_type:complete
MSDQSKIYNLYEQNLNQSGIAYMQQRNADKNYGKYTPSQGKPSYQRYGVPTVSAAKVKGAPYVPNGLSDEEILIKGYGVIDSSQAGKFLERLKKDINDLINRNVTGAILKSKIDLYTSIIKQIEEIT